MRIPDLDLALRELTALIVAGDGNLVARLLALTPELARTCFEAGATRQAENPNFLPQIGRYIWKGDTGLHIASAAYQTEIVRMLLARGSDVRAKNRLGDEALHAAVVGQPGSVGWNPQSQAATIRSLIQAGADPNALNKNGVAPLHKAVRTRCAEAVGVLLECGADPDLRNKSGSTPRHLTLHNTGRGGSGSPEAKAQQREIVLLLERHSQGRVSK